jgi:zinc transport system ATP-binding protein
MTKSDSSTLIELKNAGVKRAGKWLARGITFSLHAGEIVTLIGPNGAGKTTSAKMALGLLDLDEGAALQKSELRVGYVPQKVSIDWTLPLKVNRFLNLTGACSETEINEALAMTGTSHLLNSEVNTLSGGEFQRVLLSRAIAKKPELLVLDEPVQGVDNSGEEAMYNLIETIAKTLNCGVLLISHDLHFVMSATTHVICLNGHICCSGTPRAVSTSSEFRTLYGSKISANLAIYEHMHDHTHATDGFIVKLEEMAENSKDNKEITTNA